MSVECKTPCTTLPLSPSLSLSLSLSLSHTHTHFLSILSFSLHPPNPLISGDTTVLELGLIFLLMSFWLSEFAQPWQGCRVLLTVQAGHSPAPVSLRSVPGGGIDLECVPVCMYVCMPGGGIDGRLALCTSLYMCLYMYLYMYLYTKDSTMDGLKA